MILLIEAVFIKKFKEERLQKRLILMQRKLLSLILMEIFIITVIDLKISVTPSGDMTRIVSSSVWKCCIQFQSYVPEPEGQCYEINSYLAGDLLSAPLRAVPLSRRCFHWAVSFFYLFISMQRKARDLVFRHYSSQVCSENSLLNWHILRLHYSYNLCHFIFIVNNEN